MARRPRSRSRDYPRTARLNELLREIIAEALERIDDDRLQLVTVISVDVDSDLHRALVYVSTLDPSTDDDVLEALGELRIRVQGAVARPARLTRAPAGLFRFHGVPRSAERIDELLRDNPITDVPDPDEGTGPDPVNEA